MATTYTCGYCGATATDPTGWARAQITHTHYVSGDPVTVTGDAAVDVLDFDTDACRDAWNARTAAA